MNSHNLDTLISQKKLIVCMGTGGVGKTTISTSLAIKSALAGKRPIVLTIDPSRRLKDTLGLKPNNDIQTIKINNTSLDAMMLDMKYTFDQMVISNAPNEEIKNTILSNRWYGIISSAMAGVHEYMAMEQLYTLSQLEKYDQIIVDTPPAQHMSEFIEAPQKLFTFSDKKIIKWYLLPQYMMSKKISRFFGLQKAMTLLEKITGSEFLMELSTFFSSFASFLELFQNRSKSILALLNDDSTAYCLVSSPSNMRLHTANDILNHPTLKLNHVIFNRVTPKIKTPHSKIIFPNEVSEFKDRLVSNLSNLNQLSQTEYDVISKFSSDFKLPVTIIPEKNAKQLKTLDQLVAFSNTY